MTMGVEEGESETDTKRKEDGTWWAGEEYYIERMRGPGLVGGCKGRRQQPMRPREGCRSGRPPFWEGELPCEQILYYNYIAMIL
jgi:hypothetical protein